MWSLAECGYGGEPGDECCLENPPSVQHPCESRGLRWVACSTALSSGGMAAWAMACTATTARSIPSGRSSSLAARLVARVGLPAWMKPVTACTAGTTYWAVSLCWRATWSACPKLRARCWRPCSLTQQRSTPTVRARRRCWQCSAVLGSARWCSAVLGGARRCGSRSQRLCRAGGAAACSRSTRRDQCQLAGNSATPPGLLTSLARPSTSPALPRALRRPVRRSASRLPPSAWRPWAPASARVPKRPVSWFSATA